MTEEPEQPGPRVHPLEGVLERLIARERGAGSSPAPVFGRAAGAAAAALPGLAAPEPAPAPALDRGSPFADPAASAVGQEGAGIFRPAGSAPSALNPALPIVPRLGAPLLGLETGLSIGSRTAAGVPAAWDGAAPGLARSKGPDQGRRMLVVVGQGADRGEEALRAAVRWGLQSGRFPAVLDLLDPEPPGSAAAGGHPPGSAAVPLATIPCGLEKLREEPPELMAAVLDRLRRHELDADLLVVRVPPHPRMILMKAAFMAGGLVVPLDGSEQSLWEEFYLCQEVQQSFYGLTLWPWAAERAVLERFLTLLRNFLGIEAGAFDPGGGDFAAVLGKLGAAPEEGYVAGLLAQSAASPPPHLLAISSLDI